MKLIFMGIHAWHLSRDNEMYSMHFECVLWIGKYTWLSKQLKGSESVLWHWVCDEGTSTRHFIYPLVGGSHYKYLYAFEYGVCVLSTLNQIFHRLSKYTIKKRNICALFLNLITIRHHFYILYDWMSIV